jgi:hypothetical protein
MTIYSEYFPIYSEFSHKLSKNMGVSENAVYP